MKVFEKYADFYDSYYRDKGYNAEVNFVLDLAKQNSIPPRTILDIGCGTGGHLIPFAKKGLKVTGFDISEAMIKQAKEKLKRLILRQMFKLVIQEIIGMVRSMTLLCQCLL